MIENRLVDDLASEPTPSVRYPLPPILVRSKSLCEGNATMKVGMHSDFAQADKRYVLFSYYGYHIYSVPTVDDVPRIAFDDP